MEIAQGVLCNYALVSQTCYISLLCMFGARHKHREKMFESYFVYKMDIAFDTSLRIAFCKVKVLAKQFSEAHNIDIFGAKHIKYV